MQLLYMALSIVNDHGHAGESSKHAEDSRTIIADSLRRSQAVDMSMSRSNYLEALLPGRPADVYSSLYNLQDLTANTRDQQLPHAWLQHACKTFVQAKHAHT